MLQEIKNKSMGPFMGILSKVAKTTALHVLFTLFKGSHVEVSRMLPVAFMWRSFRITEARKECNLCGGYFYLVGKVSFELAHVTMGFTQQAIIYGGSSFHCSQLKANFGLIASCVDTLVGTSSWLMCNASHSNFG